MLCKWNIQIQININRLPYTFYLYFLSYQNQILHFVNFDDCDIRTKEINFDFIEQKIKFNPFHAEHACFAICGQLLRSAIRIFMTKSKV